MSIEQASKALGVSRMSVYRMLKDGRLTAERRLYVKSHQYRIPASEVERLLTGQPPAE